MYLAFSCGLCSHKRHKAQVRYWIITSPNHIFLRRGPHTLWGLARNWELCGGMCLLHKIYKTMNWKLEFRNACHVAPPLDGTSVEEVHTSRVEPQFLGSCGVCASLLSAWSNWRHAKKAMWQYGGLEEQQNSMEAHCPQIQLDNDFNLEASTVKGHGSLLRQLLTSACNWLQVN